jgi:hypothetical protein
MLIEIITPLMLATTPIAIVVDQPVQYNHGSQMVALNSAKEILSWTTSGTQTFGGNGRPSDSDND